jgi:hypothetical protein
MIFLFTPAENQLLVTPFLQENLALDSLAAKMPSVRKRKPSPRGRLLKADVESWFHLESQHDSAEPTKSLVV